MNTPSFSSSKLGSSRAFLLFSSFMALSMLFSCKGEFDDKDSWKWSRDGENPKSELNEWVYELNDESGVAWVATVSSTIDWDATPDMREDKLWSILDEHVAYGKKRAGSDFYTVVYNARNNKDSYKEMRSVMKWIMNRVATSSTLQVWFDADIHKWEVFEYSDSNGLNGTLKIWTSVDAGTQYVKILFSPAGESGAYNVGDAGYGFAWDIHLCCSRPVDKNKRDRQYTMWMNQWENITPKQMQKFIEQLLYGWNYVMN